MMDLLDTRMNRDIQGSGSYQTKFELVGRRSRANGRTSKLQVGARGKAKTDFAARLIWLSAPDSNNWLVCD